MDKLGSLGWLGVCVSVLAAPGLASGATCTWTGGGANSNWSTAANWNNCGGAHALPANGDLVSFVAGAARASSVNNLVGLSLIGVQIAGTSAGDQRYNISAAGVTNGITLAGTLSFNAAPDMNSLGPLFGIPISLAGPVTISNAGTTPVLVGSTIALNGFTLGFGTSGSNINVTGAMTGLGSVNKFGSQTLFVGGDNSFTGPTQIIGGTLRARHTNALGTVGGGTTVLSGATLLLEFGVTMAAEPLTLDGGSTFGSNLGPNAWTGPVSIGGAVTVNVPAATDQLIVSGSLTGASTLTKIGAGLLTLSGSSPAMTGQIVTSAGTLLANGTLSSSTINVAGGTFGGGGTVGAVLAAGGTIDPGSGPSSADSLTTGSLALNAATTVAINLGPSLAVGYDQLRVTGTVNLADATLLRTLTYTPPQNTAYRIIDNDGTDPVVGTFHGLAEGASLTIGGQPFVISYAGGTGNDVVLLTRVPALYYLSEGATGPFFDTDILLANPNPADAPVTLTFLTPTGSPIVQTRTLPARSRTTVHVDQISGLEGAEVSTVVTSTAGLPLAVERSMFWDSRYYAGHTGSAIEQPSQDWVFAEGSQGFFSTYVLLSNANATPVDVTLTFLREADTPVVKTVTVAGSARFTVDCATIAEIVNRSFGVTVHATQPITAERAMYFGNTPTRLFSGGHESAGVTKPSFSWFLAEGATGGFFDTFVLLSNPQSTDAHVTVQFLLDTGETVTETRTIPANQRVTINIEAEPDPRLANAAVSTVVSSDVPIVAERSMYWIGDLAPWTEAHNSFGVVESGVHWGLAEGRLGGPLHFHTYILLANPQTSAAAVTVTFLRETGAPFVKTYTVPPTSRFNIDVNAVAPTDMHDEFVGADLNVTNGVPIVVERSVYWDLDGVLFKGGTNATGVRLP